MNRRTLGLLAAVPVLALGLAACGGSGGGANDSGVKFAAPDKGAPNPVDILRKIPGCVIPPGTEQGDHDIYGNRYASCSVLDNSGTPGTDFTVYTASGTPKGPTSVTDDSHKVITGPHFQMYVTGNWSAYSAWLDPQQLQTLARNIGGAVQ